MGLIANSTRRFHSVSNALTLLACLALPAFNTGCSGTQGATQKKGSAEVLVVDKSSPGLAPDSGSHAWTWRSWNEKGGDHSVNFPERYVLELRSDGWFELQADCRHGKGIYESMGDRIVMVMTSITERRCPGESLADIFVGAVEASKRFEQDNDRLILHLKEGETLFFTRKE
jgi:heat shock protein HslJ